MTTFKVGQTVQRIENHRECAPIKIINDHTLQYVTDLADRGYTFRVVKDVADALDFDLPETNDGLRIHRKPFEECESCSA